MLVQLADITFGYSGETLFEGLTWQINEGDHVGLVGPNGAGKSTLLRLIAGKLQPEAGQVARVRGKTIGYLHQSQEFAGLGTLQDVLFAPFASVLKMRAELEELSHKLDDEAALERYGHLEDAYRRADGYSLESRIAELAHDVGFADADMSRSVDSLSGGERNRVELAKVLLEAPDLLLLDEPTNHLDLASCERLEGFLASYPRTFVLVSHDRFFLDRVCKKIVDVDDGGIEEYAGGWSTYVEERGKRRELKLAAVKRQQAEIERTEEFIRKNLAGVKTKQAKSRRTMLERVERLQMTSDMWQDAGRIGLRFDPGEQQSGKDVLHAEQLEVGYEGVPPLAKDIALDVYRGDRVGIVGPNGAGKSTLLKTLLGKLEPRAGSLRRGTNLKVAYFDQKLSELADDRSLVDEIRATRGDWAVDQVRTYLAKFRFFGEDVFRVVKGLSGGERNRLTLAKMMLRPANLLALDEPTNHLDIPAREVLEKALRNFHDGTLLVISHDRFFLDQVCNKLLILEDGKIELEVGNYSDWRRRLAARTRAAAEKESARKAAEAKRAAVAEREAAKKPAAASGAPAGGKDDFERDKQKKSERARKEKRLKSLEDEIAALEVRTGELRATLAAEHGGNWQSLHALVEEERELSQKLEKRMEEWEKLGAELGAG
jgi:ATP-binding cassette subfamily F protein 3